MFKYILVFLLGVLAMAFIVTADRVEKAGKKACMYGWESYDYNRDTDSYSFYCKSKPIMVDVK